MMESINVEPAVWVRSIMSRANGLIRSGLEDGRIERDFVRHTEKAYGA